MEEVLAAPDKELNTWVSLRKACQYRSQEEERKDYHVFRNKSKDQNLKKKIMPTLFDKAAEASVSAVKKIDQETSEGAGTKKRKRTKKKKKVVAATEEGKIKEPDSKKMRLENEKSKAGVTDGID